MKNPNQRHLMGIPMWAPGDSWDNSPISLPSRRVHRSFRNRRSDDDEVNVDHCGDGGESPLVTLRRKSVRSMHAGGRPLPSCNEVHRKERIDKKNSTSGRGSPSAGASAAGAASPSVLILLTCLHSGIVTVSLVKLSAYFCLNYLHRMMMTLVSLMMSAKTLA